MKKVKLDFSEQAKRMQEAIREEMEIWANAISRDRVKDVIKSGSKNTLTKSKSRSNIKK